MHYLYNQNMYTCNSLEFVFVFGLILGNVFSVLDLDAIFNRVTVSMRDPRPRAGDAGEADDPPSGLRMT